MHNNHFFLKNLVKDLYKKLRDAVLGECFSQTKNELVLGFTLNNNEDFYWRADLQSSFSCISFPKEFTRAKRNSTNLFSELIGATVQEVFVFDNERAICLAFQNDYSLVFKLFGNRSNIILYNQEEGERVFNGHYVQDKDVLLFDWNRELSFSEEQYSELNQELSKLVPTLGPELEEHFQKENLDYTTFLKKLDQLPGNDVFVTKSKGKPMLTLVPNQGALRFSDPIEAVTEFYWRYIRIHSLVEGKKEAQKQVSSKLRQAQKRLKKLEIRLEELINERSLKEVADVVMANLHQIPVGSEKVTLFDFYTNVEIEIKMKRNVSPQEYAASLYRKYKNRSKEVETVQSNVSYLKEQISLFTNELTSIEETESLRDLKKYRKEKVKQQAIDNSPQFKEYDFKGYRILVGRNSRNNDDLTKSAHKEDLWLHAKDVSGSHVVIKNKAGGNTPKEVVEYAASIAAYYSKRKTDSLCPVIVTPKKFVRKMKGAPAGAVIVEKESVVLVEPRDG